MRERNSDCHTELRVRIWKEFLLLRHQINSTQQTNLRRSAGTAVAVEAGAPMRQIVGQKDVLQTPAVIHAVGGENGRLRKKE